MRRTADGDRRDGGPYYTELGKPKLAEPLRANAIAGYDHTLVRESSLYLSWLAEDYIQLNDLGQPASIATEALILASRTSSARTDERLRHLAKLLKPHSSVTKVTESWISTEASPTRPAFPHSSTSYPTSISP